MHRFFVAPDTLAAGLGLRLTGATAHQIARVLRLRPGEEVILLDGGGDEWRVRLTAVAPSLVTGEIEERRPGTGEPALRLTLYQAVLKGDRMDYAIQKGTEVGLAAFALVHTERTVARGDEAGKIARWERIAREAAEQAGRSVVPPIRPPVPLAAALAGLGGTPLLAFWEEERATGLAAALADLPRPLPPLSLLVGPEGGLAPAETAAARSVGATVVTLGPRILRAETAGLVAAAALLYAAGDLGGPPPPAPSDR